MKMEESTLLLVLFLILLLCAGCVESPATTDVTPFDEQSVDACLSIVVDMSASFRERWDDRAYDLFLDISERFFTEASMGGDTKLIIGQLSGSKQVLLFEGRPQDLRRKFRGPEEFNQFLKDRSDPTGSQVFDATRRAVEHVGSVAGVSDDTKLLTVILSDMQDSHGDLQAQAKMIDSLREYAGRGGALALYFVAESEAPRWRAILDEAAFRPGYSIIENELAASPQLPRFE
ncbi:MAG: hypothetical protein R3C19_12230 [Planctomycetaceae bacterium]